MDLTTYLSQHPKKYLIFDLDSTLIKLHIDWTMFRREIWDTVAVFDEPLTKEIPFERWKGIELANKAIARHGERAKKIINAFNESYESRHISGYTVNPSLIDFIKTNTQYVYFMWTSSNSGTIEPFLKEYDMKKYFKKIITRNMLNYIKPDPDGFTQIYIKGTDKKDYLMIGDNFTDEQAAAVAGIDFFLVNYFKKV